jgi:5,5'-dehydrodivanillate O-demethylase
MERFEIREVPYGLMKKRIFKDGRNEAEHPLIFPNILRVQNCTEIRVPTDDTHTNHFRIYFEPTGEAAQAENGVEPRVEYCAPFKEPPDALHPFARFHKWYEPPVRNPVEDYMAWETQAPISDRTSEHLATSDRGIVILRELMRREIGRMQQGLDPKGVIRDPDHAVIDTGLKMTPPPDPLPSRGGGLDANEH